MTIHVRLTRHGIPSATEVPDLNYHNVRLARHDMPSATEVAALIVSDTTENGKVHDIIVQYKDMRPRRISENHSKFMVVQYPLLFHYGEDGYRGNIHCTIKEGAKCKRNHVNLAGV